MGEWDKFSADEQQQIFYDRKTWNLVRNNNRDSGCQAKTNITNTNHQIKQLQARPDDSKKRLAPFLDTAEN